MCEANLIKNPFFPSSHATTGEQLKHYNPFCSRSLLARKEKKIGQTVDKEFSFVVKGCLLELITVTRLLKSHFQAFFPVFLHFSLSQREPAQYEPCIDIARGRACGGWFK